MEDYSYIPEKALGLAIITRAMLDAIGQTALTGAEPISKEQYYIRQAKAWLFSAYDDRHKDPFTFPWWCEHCEIEPARVRAFVLRGASGRVTTNRMDDLSFYIRVFDDHTTAPFQLAL